MLCYGYGIDLDIDLAMYSYCTVAAGCVVGLLFLCVGREHAVPIHRILYPSKDVRASLESDLLQQ